MAGVLAKGIDVSEFNGPVDFAALKGKIDFAILRCGYGSDYVNQDDKEFEENVRKCQAAGIPYGAYLYSYAKTVEMAQSEARHALRLLAGKEPLYGVWYDVEDSSLPEGETLIDNVVAFCDGVREAGYCCGVYSFLYWMVTRLNSPRLDKYLKWVAQWNSTLDYDKPVALWQYTDSGVLLGKKFDMNKAYVDLPGLCGRKEEPVDREEAAAIAREEAQQVYRENEDKYKTIADLPEWARASAQRVYTTLGLTGTGDPKDLTIDASETYARTLVVIDKVLNLLPDAPGKE